jgi:VWFA-related protein
MTARPRLIASISLAMAISLAPAAQQQTQTPEQAKPQRPVFRGGTQLVRVDAYPTAKDGRIIEGLTADDFEVFEDGKPQKVETFDFERFETWTPDGERKDPKSQQEAYDLAADPAWRVFVIVIDPGAYNMEGQHYLRAPLTEFIERDLGPHDLFGLLTTENEWTDLTLGQQTTIARGVLDSEEWRDPGAIEQRAYLDLMCGGPLKRLDNEYALLEGLVKLLGLIREEKKSILFVSSGLGTPAPGRGRGAVNPIPIPAGKPVGVPGGRGGSMGHGDAIGGRSHNENCEAEQRRLENIDFLKRFHDLLDDARHANVAFYPISPRGLEAPPIHADRPGLISVDQTRRELDAISHRNDTLLTLASNTDGIAIVNTNDFTTGVRRIANDAQAYYILGYYPTNSQFDGRVRTIKVTLKSTGKSVRARHQYRAPTLAEVSPARESVKPAIPPAVQDALDRLTVSIGSREHDLDGPLTAPVETSSLVEDPIAVRRGSPDPVTPFAFERTEHIRLEWPTRGAVDRAEARLLDRMGHPLTAQIPVMLDASRTPDVVVAELPLTALAHGDYVLEVTVTAGSATQKTDTAFRVR